VEPTTLLLVHAAATWAMVGLIWFVQVVHYPLFAFVPQQGFTEWQQANLPRTTKVVLPPMAVEFLCTLLLLFEAPERLQPLAWTGAALMAFVWLSTVFLQVPCHGTPRCGATRLPCAVCAPPTGCARSAGPHAASSPR